MNGKYRVIAVLLFTHLIALSSAFSTRAAVESVSVAYPTLDIGDSAPLSFPLFNPDLGTLTDIMIKLTSSDTVESLVYNPNSTHWGYYTGATATTSVTVTAFPGLSTTTTLQAGPANGSIRPHSFVVAATQRGTIVNTIYVPPSGFGQYIGKGRRVFDVDVQQSAGTYSGSYSSPGAQLFFGGYGNSFGTVEIDYTYVAVPEMSTAYAGVTGLAAAVLSIKALRCPRKLLRCLK